MSRVRVLGLGNVLMGDDGFGPWAARVLAATWELAGDASIDDLGTPGFDLIPQLAGADALILLDTVAAHGAPGEVRVVAREALLSGPARPRLGPHDSALRDAFFALELSGRAPADVVLVGVVPARVAKGTGLSAAVRAAYPEVEAAVLRELERLGVPARRRPRPRDPDLWWERAPCTK